MTDHEPHEVQAEALATFAEFEVDLLRMRTREGMAVARARGKLRGKPPKLTTRQQSHLVRVAVEPSAGMREQLQRVLPEVDTRAGRAEAILLDDGTMDAVPWFRDGFRDDRRVSHDERAAVGYDNSVRIGYARVSTRTQDHQAQLDALAAASCREIVVETASTRGERPKLYATLGELQAGDTLVIYKPDRVARSMKELLVLLEDQLHARGVNLHILSGICAGLHRPNSASIGDKMLLMVAAMAAEMERDLIRERTLDGLRAAEAAGRRGGRPGPGGLGRAGRGDGPPGPWEVGLGDRPAPGDRPVHRVPGPPRAGPGEPLGWLARSWRPSG